MLRPHSQRFVASALCGLLAAGMTPLTARVAGADEPVRLLLIPFKPIQGQVPDSTGSKIEEILGDEIHNHDDVQMATYSPPAPPPAAPAPSPAPGGDVNVAVADRLDQGEAMVKHFKFKQAEDALTAAIGDYEALPAQVDVKVLRDAYIALALAQLREGDNDAGMDSLAAVIRLAPDLPLGGGYPPPFRRAFDQQKRKVSSAPRASVNIKGEGQIFLDSREQAAAPTTIDDVIPGSHFLRVQRADGSVWGLKLIVNDGDNAVTIPEGGEVKKPAVAAAGAPSGPFASIARNQIDDSLLADVAQAGTDAAAPFVLFGGLYKTADGNIGFAPHLYSERAHGEVALDPVMFDPDFVSAGIVTNKLVGNILAQIKSFGTPEDLPAPVAALRKPAAKPVVAAVAPVAPVAPIVRPVAKPVAKPAPAPDEGDDNTEKVATTEPKTHTVTATPVDNTPAGGLTSSNTDKSSSDDSGPPILLYGAIGAGAAVVIAAVVTSIVVVSHNNTPVTGSASLSFQ